MGDIDTLRKLIPQLANANLLFEKGISFISKFQKRGLIFRKKA